MENTVPFCCCQPCPLPLHTHNCPSFLTLLTQLCLLPVTGIINWRSGQQKKCKQCISFLICSVQFVHFFSNLSIHCSNALQHECITFYNTVMFRADSDHLQFNNGFGPFINQSISPSFNSLQELITLHCQRVSVVSLFIRRRDQSLLFYCCVRNRYYCACLKIDDIFLLFSVISVIFI